MREVTISLQELLSLYTGGRPIGLTDIPKQKAKFIKNYNKLKDIDPAKAEKPETKTSRNENLRNIVISIEERYPIIRKIKKSCKEYMAKYPAMCDENAKENIITFANYQWDTTKLLKEARKTLGSSKEFTIKNYRLVTRK